MASDAVAATRSRRPRAIVGPLILLGAGLVILLNNLGVVPWSIWSTVWPYWPVLLVVIGVEALVNGRLSWGSLVLTALLVGVGSLVLHAGDMVGEWSRHGPPTGTLTGQVRQDLGAANRANVRIRFGGGWLNVGPLLEGSLLAEGELYGERSAGLESRYAVRDGVGELLIQPRSERRTGPRFAGGPERLDLRLSRTVPLDVRVEAGAADTVLDLRDLAVPGLRLETGASRSTIITPAAGSTVARVEGGAANLTVQIPPQVDARIRVDSGLSDIRIDQTRFPRQGSEYRSPDFDNAQNWIDLVLEVGVARVDVQ